MSRLNRLRQISASDWRLLLEAALLLPLTAAGLRTLGFGRWRWVLASLAPSHSQSVPHPIGDARHVSNIVSAAARKLGDGPNCLQRSLVLWWLLRREGIDSDIRFGARKISGEFGAHAWVECHGAVLNDTEDVCKRFSGFGRVSPTT